LGGTLKNITGLVLVEIIQPKQFNLPNRILLSQEVKQKQNASPIRKLQFKKFIYVPCQKI
jgi:hypothetical protein